MKSKKQIQPKKSVKAVVKKAAKPVKATKPAGKPAKPAKPGKPAAKTVAKPAVKKGAVKVTKKAAKPAKPAKKAVKPAKPAPKGAPAKQAKPQKPAKVSKPAPPAKKAKAAKPGKAPEAPAKKAKLSKPAPKRAKASDSKPAKPVPKPVKSTKSAPAPKPKAAPSTKATKPAGTAVKAVKVAKAPKAEKPAKVAKPKKAPKAAKPAPPPSPPARGKSIAPAATQIGQPPPRTSFVRATAPPLPIFNFKIPPMPKEPVISGKTPRQAHYRMPAEWEPHLGTWITWPSRKGISFPGKTAYDEVLPGFLSMIHALLSSEEVFLNVSDPEDRQYLEDNLTIAERRRLHLVDIPAMEPWCRDHGCTFVLKDEGRIPGAVTWKFNSWGQKYDKALPDAQISQKMAMHMGVKIFDPGVVMEGGAIEVNGTGTVITTESCLLNKNRNRGLKKDDVEKFLKDYLSVSNILWLESGVEGDDTDGHIDDITRFVSRHTVITMVENDPKDPNHLPLQRNLERLKEMKAEDGTPLEIIPLQMPAAIVRKGQRLPASYANFYIGNKIVLLPTFGDPADEKALETMVKCFPTRRIYPIDCKEIIWGLGTFHCLTQQIPLGFYPLIMNMMAAGWKPGQ